MAKTIVGISTALGVGAISIIRLSGPDAIKIVDQVFVGNKLKNQPTHTIHYGFICLDQEKIDEVLVSIMRAPKTYTKEDVVEINCHGGIATTNKVLETLLNQGATLAEPGEFTKRAFLNGRIDLIEAEGVMNLIRSETELNRQVALNQLKGSVSEKINEIRNKIKKIIANIAVNIDYPEYDDVPIVENQKLKKEIKQLKKELEQVYEESKHGKIVQEGIETVIIGKPNVGKSSLLNALIEENKAIVTEIAGTTRDIVEGKLNLGGVLLNIIDTAGIRNTKNKIEKIGVEKSLSLIEKGELILFVVAQDQKITSGELEILKKIKDKNHIVVINKKDLVSKIEKETLKEYNYIEISTFDHESVIVLKEKIKEIFNLAKIKQQDLTYLTSARSISLLKQCLKIIKEIEEGIQQNQPPDVLELDLKRLWQELGLITGQVFEEEIIEQIFADFCLGK